MEEKTFQQENNEILRSVINKGFIDYLSGDKKIVNEKMGIELYITTECNQRCSYCYLCANDDKLYPKEIRNRETILKNYKIFLDYCVEKKLKPQHFDLFTGEIWESDFGVEILSILVDYLENQKDFMPELIMIPSNCSFIFNDKYLPKIEAILKRVINNEEIPTRICFSCSNDGLYIDKLTRPYNDPKRQELKGTQEYYDKMFEFCKKWNFAFHPMVSAHGIEAWEENFKWWMETIRKYDLDPLSYIMFLETRNNDWTEEKIIHYLRYINYSIDYLIENEMPRFGNKLESYVKYMNGHLHKAYNKFNPLRPITHAFWPTCSIARTLTVRLGDLAIVPCHRLSYDELNFGKFVVKNDKIVDVEAKNIQMMNQIWLNNMYGSAKCNYCPYNALCTRGCYGSQYESTGELLYPCETVCDLYKAKSIFLYEKYKQLGILDKLTSNTLTDLYNKIKETEEYKKWSEIAQNLI